MVARNLRIGSLKLEHGVVCAPMVDVSDLAFRLLCKEAGAALTYTEMIYSEAIVHENKKTLNMLKTIFSERPVGVQIAGGSVEEFARVAGREELNSFSLVDVNCGCPSVRITGNAAGSYLLKTPTRIGEMIRVLKEKHEIVTAKIRLGFKVNNAVKVAKIIEKAGADALTIHARLSHERGNVKARWDEIARVKKEVGIPVIGNGDVVSGEKAKALLELCDGAMVARAAIGNPLIFREILGYLRTGKEKLITQKERVAQFRKYIVLARKYDLLELSRVKFLGGHFLRDFAGAGEARQKLMQCKGEEEIKDLLATL